MSSSPTSSLCGTGTVMHRQANNATVDLLELATSALASSIAASQPIRKLAQQDEPSAERGCEGEERQGSKNVRLKLDGTVVTDADGAAQRIIVSAIRHVSANVRIVGEESGKEMEKSLSREFEKAASRFREMELNGQDDPMAEESAAEHEIAGIFQMAQEEVARRHSEAFSAGESADTDPYDVRADGGDTDTPEPSAVGPQSTGNSTILPSNNVVDASRVSIFIDPLDGTSCYASGKHEYVTTLVAIIVDNTPCFGVICKPFGHEGEPCILNSGCFAVYGGTLLNGIYVAGGDEIERSRSYRESQLRRLAGDDAGESEERSSSSSAQNQRAVISKSRAGGVVRKCIDALADEGLLNRDPVYVSGAGVKALQLLVGSEDEALWFFPKPGTSLWDVAAADALLRVVGGRLSDKDGKDIDYSKSRRDADNVSGVVACNDSMLHGECIRIFQGAEWRDED